MQTIDSIDMLYFQNSISQQETIHVIRDIDFETITKYYFFKSSEELNGQNNYFFTVISYGRSNACYLAKDVGWEDTFTVRNENVYFCP